MCVSTLAGAGGEVEGGGAMQVITQTAWETLPPFLSIYCESRCPGAPGSPSPLIPSLFTMSLPSGGLLPRKCCSPGAGWRPRG